MHDTVDVSSWEVTDATAPGQRRKEWLIDPRTQQYALFKMQRYHMSELAAEKAAADVGKIIGISTAKTELAKRGDAPGIISYNFVSVQETLIHGGDLLVGIRPNYDRTRAREQTFQLIEQGLPQHLLGTLIEVIVFDALIGNTDRHHDNWGIIRLPKPEPDRLAPAYDHGSCLGSHVEDDKIGMADIDAYIRRGRAAVRWLDDQEVQHLPHIQLLRRIRTRYAEEIGAAVEKVLRVREVELVAAIDELPDAFASDVRRRFMVELLRGRLQVFRELGL